MGKIIGIIDMEIFFGDTRGKDFEEIKDKMFNF